MGEEEVSQACRHLRSAAVSGYGKQVPLCRLGSATGHSEPAGSAPSAAAAWRAAAPGAEEPPPPLPHLEHDERCRDGQQREHDVIDGAHDSCVEQVQRLVEVVYLRHQAADKDLGLGGQRGNGKIRGWAAHVGHPAAQGDTERLGGGAAGSRLPLALAARPSSLLARARARRTTMKMRVWGSVSWLFPMNVSFRAMPRAWRVAMSEGGGTGPSHLLGMTKQ